MTNLVPVEAIVRKIVFVRGEKVLLDRDLAELYGVETKQLKRAVRRNIDRFPKDFMFHLTNEEHWSLRRQFGTLKRGAHSKYSPCTTIRVPSEPGGKIRLKGWIHHNP